MTVTAVWAETPRTKNLPSFLEEWCQSPGYVFDQIKLLIKTPSTFLLASRNRPLALPTFLSLLSVVYFRMKNAEKNVCPTTHQTYDMNEMRDAKE